MPVTTRKVLQNTYNLKNVAHLQHKLFKRHWFPKLHRSHIRARNQQPFRIHNMQRLPVRFVTLGSLRQNLRNILPSHSPITIDPLRRHGPPSRRLIHKRPRPSDSPTDLLLLQVRLGAALLQQQRAHGVHDLERD
ncbi:unnamed protein product [Chondrus crispus]|uniref:Uncharacterized protein n=1 Tax=Chondrus crispus TaxID=2769 RepID=R7QA86_CHOCR|nr:unnamed protein product [Chondrus crispus]CDF35432.1 unnamed protein product [Chondrus crispus]|eukprot:XP_005715251.1 unnamed protein product [Chondrus crispus]